MQSNGLGHDKTITGGAIHEETGGVRLSDCPEHSESLAFRRILLVANAPSDIRAAIVTACTLIDRSQGELVLLEVGERFSSPPFLPGSAAGANQASEIDLPGDSQGFPKCCLHRADRARIPM